MTSRSSKTRTIQALKIRMVSDKDPRSIHVKTHIVDGKKIVTTKALIDSGTQGIFMNQQLQRNTNSCSLNSKRRYPYLT